MMPAGRLDRRVTLQQVAETRSSSGDVVQSWSELATVWAGVQQPSGRTAFEATERQARGDAIFRIRYRDDVTAKNRILYQGDIYEILAIKEIGRREGLEIAANARVL